VSWWQRFKHWAFGSIQTTQRAINEKSEVFPANYSSNRVNNQKYSFFTFVPLFLFNMYKDLINLYFLLILIVTGYVDLKSSILTRKFHRVSLRKNLPGRVRTYQRNHGGSDASGIRPKYQQPAVYVSSSAFLHVGDFPAGPDPKFGSGTSSVSIKGRDLLLTAWPWRPSR